MLVSSLRSDPRCDQPERETRNPRGHRRGRPRAMEDRISALAAGHRLREDDSTVRTRSGPRIMAVLRNLAIGALRLHGRTDIAEATRWAARNTARPFAVLGLTP